MKILVVLTYYHPHTSGLTIYAERLAEAFVQRGHTVTVLTSRFDKKLPESEVFNGVTIIRVPVLFRISKGVIMPKFGRTARRLIKQHDVIQIHLPQFDSAGVAFWGKYCKKPTVVTYHCDLIMPRGLIAWVANKVVLLMNWLTVKFAHSALTYTQDYADHSSFLKKFSNKLSIALPPVVMPEVGENEILEFGRLHNPDGRIPLIGMAVRFATEKGVEVLLNALPKVFESYPQAKVLFAGPYQNIAGEEHYFNKLIGTINILEKSGSWKFLGNLSRKEMAAFYSNLDILVLPSLNSTEAFGLVQIEAMFHGVPCIASNLPGVRRPVQMHQMGEIIPIGDSKALADTILNILENKSLYRIDTEKLKSMYLPDSVAIVYEQLFEKIKKDIH